MTDEQMTETTIYVLPSAPGMPPRAMVGQGIGDVAIVGAMATWSTDMGAWMIEGMPVPQELGDAITEHAKSLGIEW